MSNPPNRRRHPKRVARIAICAAVTGAMVLPASAAAADSYVDRDTGDDANIATDCPQANPCETVAVGVTAATNAGAGNTVRVDDSSSPYELSGVGLFLGVSVIAEDFVGGIESPTGRPILETAAAASQGLFIGGADNAGTVRGFTFRPNDKTAISASGTMTAIEDNVFEDPGASGTDIGVILGATSPIVNGNLFTDLSPAIRVVAAGSAQIVGNEFSGSRAAGAIQLAVGSPTLTGNFFHDPGAGAGNAVTIGNSGSTNAVAATFRRNRILGAFVSAVSILDGAGPFSFDGDLIAGATLCGLCHADIDDNGDSEVTATNVTIVSAGTAAGEISNHNSELTLDSGIIGGQGIDAVGTATCAISFSRGPVAVPGAPGCQAFQTTADPTFVNPAGEDFHLQAGSPMIDAGNPAAPDPFSLDIDGQARVQEGDGACPIDPRRDIGADEFAAALPDCPTVATPPAPVPKKKKKCKKGRKLKKGKCVKKKKKKKRKRKRRR